MISQVTGVPPQDVHIDLPVRVDLVEVEDGYVLPLLAPRSNDK